MAKIASSFQCVICQQYLNFGKDIEMTDFIILLLQFHKIHTLCEMLQSKPQLKPEDVVLKE